MFFKKKYDELVFMYPALLKPGKWENPEGVFPIRKMGEKHIKNTINMLKVSPGCLQYLENQKEHNENEEYLEKAIEIIESKIEEFEEHLNNGLYDMFY